MMKKVAVTIIEFRIYLVLITDFLAELNIR